MVGPRVATGDRVPAIYGVTSPPASLKRRHDWGAVSHKAGGSKARDQAGSYNSTRQRWRSCNTARTSIVSFRARDATI
jgi:hypothetical protein